MRILFELRLWGLRLCPTDGPHPLLTSVYCPFKCMRHLDPRKRSCVRACLRPTEAARFRLRKCANNHLLIVAGVPRFLRHAYAARSRVIQTRKTLCALRIYKHTLIGVLFEHGNGNMLACLTLR